MELPQAELERVQAELERRFSRSGGCIARATDFALLFPTASPAVVEEALHRLYEAGAAEMECLSNGALVYRFPPG